MHLVLVTKPRNVKLVEMYGVMRDRNPSIWKTSTDPSHYLGWQKGDCTDVNSMDACYLKLWPTLDMETKDSVIELHWEVLDHYDWYFNTTENHGFYLNASNEKNGASFSVFNDEMGSTYHTMHDICRHYGLATDHQTDDIRALTRALAKNPCISNGELIIPNADIPPKYIKQIIRSSYAGHY